jgi:hypothetical protein
MPVISSQPENGLKRSGVTYGELAKRLESHGLHETEASITNKLASSLFGVGSNDRSCLATDVFRFG